VLVGVATRQFQCHTASCVQRVLDADPELGSLGVRVIADGVGLCLCGSLPTAAERERVLRFVRASTRGAVRVRVRLSIAGSLAGAPV
jgi:hypothetical protein